MNEPLASLDEKLTPVAHFMAASRHNITLAQLPLSKTNQELSRRTSKLQEAVQVQLFNHHNKMLHSQKNYINKNGNSTQMSYRPRNSLNNKKMKNNRSLTDNAKLKISILSKVSPSNTFNTEKHKIAAKVPGTNTHSNKLLNSAESVNIRTNLVKTKLVRPKLSTKFVDDIHNFHVPDRQKILASRNQKLEDALNQAAMDPQDHILTGKLCQDCQAMGFSYDLNVEDICQGNVHLLIIVESPPNNRMARDAIRKTWGMISQVSASEIRVVFLLGKSSLPSENQLAKVEHWHNQDVIQIDFMDAYANLTYKTLSGMHWVHTFCSNAKYVMKTDDDMYVNTPLIVKMLRATPKTKFLGGYCWGISTPHRDSRSKWYVPYEMYSASTFPPMCSGTGYIMSRDLVDSVINVSVNIKFFYLEDVYIALCLEKFQIIPVNIQGFSNMLVSFDRCQFRNFVLTSHGHSPFELREAWPIIQTCPPKELTPHQLFMPIPYPEVD